MNSPFDRPDMIWPPEPPQRTDLGASAGFRPPSTPAERRAEETTRVAREMTDAVADARHSKVEKLRQARLAREAEEAEAARVAAAAAPVKKTRKRT